MATLTMELVKNIKKGEAKDYLAAFDAKEVAKVRAFHRSMWGYYHETPLLSLPHFAEKFGVKAIYVKDESKRFGLKAFKALGGSYAIASYLAKKYGVEVNFDALMNLNLSEKAPDLTFATTTDGNHGRGVAWTAKVLGVKAMVYMPAGSTKERVDNITGEGATVKVTDRNYDETVRLLAKDAAANNWVVVQDTAWEDYTEIPLKIMQGYTTMVGEALDKLESAPTHVFAQAGVGSMAAAVEGVLVNKYGKDAPIFTILEAEAANCFYRSFKAQSPVAVTGSMNTIMAGLACGEVNPMAWDILHGYADFALSCHDDVAALGMRLWGNPLDDDPKITSGESGAIGGGVLGLLDKYHDLKTELGLNKDSVLLFFNTEGDTSPKHYRKVVWGGELPCSIEDDIY